MTKANEIEKKVEKWREELREAQAILDKMNAKEDTHARIGFYNIQCGERIYLPFGEIHAMVQARKDHCVRKLAYWSEKQKAVELVATSLLIE